MGKDIEDSGERNAGVHWLAFCALGMVSSLALYGVALEYATSGGRKLHELSFVFVTTTVYAITAGFMKWLFGEASADIPKKHMLILSFTSLASSWTSVRSLRYVIYPVQVLFKSCKPVPVMAFGVALGKKYPLKKYVITSLRLRHCAITVMHHSVCTTMVLLLLSPRMRDARCAVARASR